MLVAMALLFVLAPGLHAQELVVSGRIIGPDGNPVPGHRVVLHRVDGSGGATIAETFSEGDGRFELRAEASADDEAILFVAARYDEELYIGPPFRGDEASASEQFIQVGIPELSASAMMEQDGGLPMPMQRRTEQSRTWLLVLIPLLGVAGVAVYALIPKGQVPHDRALLIRVAELDERMDAAPEAHRQALTEERERLMAELRQG